MKSISTKINTIFWDLDGTLIDSEYIHDDAVIYACKVLNMPFDVSKMAPGQDAIAVFKLIYGEIPSSKNEDVYNKWYNIAVQYTIDNFYKARQIPQTIELVHEFARLGIAQSIVSNTVSQIIHQCMDTLDIKQHLSHFIGRDSVNQGKPSPEPYLKAMQLHNVTPENCLVFEDSYTGIQAAVKAGIKVIGVGDKTRALPINIDHVCSLSQPSWLCEIKHKYL